MAQMMTPRDKVGRVEFLFEQLSDARELSSCCVGVEAHLDRLADDLTRQRKLRAPRQRGLASGFQKLIKAG